MAPLIPIADSSNATVAKPVTSSDSDCGRSSDWSTSMSMVATSDNGAEGSSCRTT